MALTFLPLAILPLAFLPMTFLPLAFLPHFTHKVLDEFDYGTNRTRRSKLFALEFGKIAESDFVYTVASTNIDQSAPNLVKMFLTIRSWMSDYGSNWTLTV